MTLKDKRDEVFSKVNICHAEIAECSGRIEHDRRVVDERKKELDEIGEQLYVLNTAMKLMGEEL